ncbi:MAG TPA: hypothetical protein VHV82_19765 [Sporichthyaceae bacterium]|jgi:hypothetical protein|nr:hypothetical protein [Sporichthyaceae bacterium]
MTGTPALEPLGNVLASIELPRPPSLEFGAWQAIEDNAARLRAAVAADDRPLAVGCCRELVESIAKVIVEVRSGTVRDRDDFQQVVNHAHGLIQYQPGDGLALESYARGAADKAKKLAFLLGEFRNARGTGHGRSFAPEVADEVLEMCLAAALLWSRWALRRVEHYILGDIEKLVHDLSGGGWFHRGTLKQRLLAADLPRLSKADQHRLGVAVGRRVAGNTFVVRGDGVDACIWSQDSAAWPVSYRFGLVEGLFIDSNGQLHVDDQSRTPRMIADLYSVFGDMTGVVVDLRAKVARALWSKEFVRQWTAVVAEMTLMQASFEGDDQRDWAAMITELTTTGAHHDGLIPGSR